MLFWQRDSFVLLAPMMSGMKDSQFLGHSLGIMMVRIASSASPLQDGHQDEVQFVQVGFLLLHQLWTGARLDDQAHNVPDGVH